MFPPRYRLPIFRNYTEQIRCTFPGNANLLLGDETENMDKSRRTKNIRFSWSLGRDYSFSLSYFYNGDVLYIYFLL